MSAMQRFQQLIDGRFEDGTASFENLPAGGCAFHIDLPVALPPAEPQTRGAGAGVQP